MSRTRQFRTIARPVLGLVLAATVAVAGAGGLLGCSEDDGDFTSSVDVDGDGIGGDGTPPDVDNCPFDPNPAQINSDGDAFGDVCDCTQTASACERESTFRGTCTNATDDDGDGLTDAADPNCRVESSVFGNCLNGIDDDGDAAMDCLDVDCATAVGC